MRVLVPCFALAATAAAWAAERPVLCGSFPERWREELQLHRAAPAPNPRAPSIPSRVDIGDIAIVDSSGGVLGRRNDFDLSNRTVSWRRAGTRYAFTTSRDSYDAGMESGTGLGLGDDDSREVPLPFPFPFFRQTYRSVWVNSDGNLTFEEGDASTASRSIGRMASGAPRIAALFRDLDPSRAGRVWITSTGERFTVSWAGVPEYREFGVGPLQTFQIRLYRDGRIDLAYGLSGTASAVVGIGPGRGESLQVVSLEDPGEFEGAIAERFERLPEIDVIRAAQRFFENHDDAYDYVVFFNGLGVSAGGNALAFQLPVRVAGSGYGLDRLDLGRTYGSARQLQSVINMGPLSQYPADPNAPLPGRTAAGDTTLTALAHEVGHQYLAFANLPGLLGRQRAHWSFYFNSDASLLEGNRILDAGAGASPRFRSVATVEGFSALDRYLMGFGPQADVPPTFYVRPASTFWTPENPPQRDAQFNGDRVDVTVEDIAKTLGRRTPDWTVSQRRFRLGFVLIVAEGTEPNVADIAQLDNIRRQFERFFARAANGAATAETSIRRAVRLSAEPAAGVREGQSAMAEVSLTAPAPQEIRFRLSTSEPWVEVPGTVAIPAGGVSATFAIRGRSAGVSTLVAEPSDPRYRTAEARIRVASSGLGLRAVLRGDTAEVRLTDADGLPYSGVAIRAAVVGGSVVEPAEAKAGIDGVARFRVRAGAGHVSFSAEGVPPIEVSGSPLLSEALNSASLDGRLTAGGLISFYGAGLSGATRLATDGPPARLVRVTAGEVLAILGEGTTRARIETERGLSNELPIVLRPRAPAVFVDGASGRGAVIGPTGSIGIVRPGDSAEIYATGIRLGDEIEVWVGGAVARLLYAAPSPVFPGLWQINVEIPGGLPAGASPLRLTAGGESAPPVTVIVERRS